MINAYTYVSASFMSLIRMCTSDVGSFVLPFIQLLLINIHSFRSWTYLLLDSKHYHEYHTAQSSDGGKLGKTNFIHQYFTQPKYRLSKVAIC